MSEKGGERHMIFKNCQGHKMCCDCCYGKRSKVGEGAFRWGNFLSTMLWDSTL